VSDLEVVAALDAMERLLHEGITEPEAILDWRKRFETALAAAEHGPGWPGIVARAHALSERLESAARSLSEQRDQLRKEMDLHAQGARALRGYKPG